MNAIDCHVHLNGYRESEPLNLEDRSKELIRYMNNYDIDISLILSSYQVTANRPSVDRLLKVVEKNENLKIVAGYTVDNHTSRDFKHYAKWIKEQMVIGIKIYCGYEPHFPSDKSYQKIYDLCIEWNVPVMMHCGDTLARNAKLKFAHPLNVDEVAADNPELKIVICHLGNPWIVDCQEILYKNKNVYSDISGLFYGPPNEYYENSLVQKIKELLGYTSRPHHLLFGTDWPISDVRSCFRLVKKLALSPEDHNLLMYGNAEKLFNL